MEHKIFRQLRNDRKDIEALAGGYKSKIDHELWLADGLQKDAIQNSWDARIDKKTGKNWECGFYLGVLNNKEFLCISDWGTTGLCGTMFYDENKLVEILNNNKPKEDLAYFLNSNWSAKSSEEGGNRGRGKTLFLASSKDKKIFFDSLRASDEKYVFGELYLDSDNQVKFSLHYEADGKAMLEKVTDKQIPPINWYGTRVFIINPETKIIESVKNGEMLSFISNSRWESIKKYGAKIFVNNGIEKKYAELPYWYKDNLKDVKSIEFPSEIIRTGTNYKIKQLVLKYAPNQNLPEEIKGVAIQRGGMTIQRLKADELVHEEGIGNIYGWVEMESKPLEEEMKLNCEGPEHFDFSWSASPAKYLRDFIKIKIRDFAKDLNILESAQYKKNIIQKIAEEEAQKLLAPLFKNLGLFGKHTGNNKKKKSTTRNQNELLRLSISDIKFPRENRRVNYGEKIENVYVIPINEYKQSLRVLVKIFIISDKGNIEIIDEKEMNLGRGRGEQVGIDSLEISNKYPAGSYSIRAKLVSLESKNIKTTDGTRIEKGTILYERINQKFYVEIDPVQSGPFLIQPRGRDDKKYLFEWEKEDNGYIIYYNELHPRIKMILDDLEKLKDYLIEQTALIAFQIKLEETVADNDKSDEDFTRLIKSKDLTGVWQLFIKKYSEFLWNIKK